MNDNTINADVTMGGPNGALLAGRYRVVRQLGQGGMGSVWLAEDTKLDGFEVAIKMLPSVLVNNKRAYAQVKAEALVSLKLSHPNIVTVRAFEEEGGNPFLVMDYVDGQTLDDYLAEKGKLTEEETIKLLKPVAAALDYAHSQGVVHRDVKPGNVMIRKDGVPFVLDFGIAREIQETMTRVTGKLSSGTLLYMSPEQLHGEAPKPAQDIYSFAAMAYECLTGHPPFERGQIEHDKPVDLASRFMIGSGVMAGLLKDAKTRPPICTTILSKVDIGELHNSRTKKWGLGSVLFGIAALSCLLFFVWRNANRSQVPERRKILANLAWDCYEDEYYRHTDAERAAEKKKPTKEMGLWAIPAVCGYDKHFSEIYEKKDFESVKRIAEFFKNAQWDEGWLELERHDSQSSPIWQFYRGVCAENGYGAANRDLKAASRWYHLAAKKECVEALYNLGVFYEFGVGVDRDVRRAAGFYQRASLKGDDEAGKRWLELRRNNKEISEREFLNIFQREVWPKGATAKTNEAYMIMRDEVGRFWCVPFGKLKSFLAANNREVDVVYVFSNDKKECREIPLGRLSSWREKDFGISMTIWDGKRMVVQEPSDEQVIRMIAVYGVLKEHVSISILDSEPQEMCKDWIGASKLRFPFCLLSNNLFDMWLNGGANTTNLGFSLKTAAGIIAGTKAVLKSQIKLFSKSDHLIVLDTGDELMIQNRHNPLLGEFDEFTTQSWRIGDAVTIYEHENQKGEFLNYIVFNETRKGNYIECSVKEQK